MVLEPLFLLTYYGGFTLTEAYNIPVEYKSWFINRISQEFQKAAEGQQQSRAAHDNTPDMRALQGMSRDNVPSRLRRFT